MPTTPARFAALQLVGWLVLSILVNSGRATFWIDVQGATAAQMAGRMVLWALFAALLSTVLWLLVERGGPAESLRPLRLLGLGAACMALGLVFATVDRLEPWPLPPMPEPRSGRGPPLWARATVPGLALFAWTSGLMVLQSVDRYGREHARALRAEALASEARLAMLRNELNPHFLFNALNSVIGVISEEPARAQGMVRQLSGLLRHTLSAKETSTLAEEVRVAEQYLAIEQVRFEERLAVHIDVPEALRCRSVPPMLLQPLVENAVKHGMGVDTLHVRISAEESGDRLRLVVANNGRLDPRHGTGVGLRNLRERLQHDHPDGSVELVEDEGQVLAVVDLPLGED